MNITYKLILITALAVSCNTNQTENSNTTQTQTKNSNSVEEQEITLVNDTTPKVTGIGGIFFRSKDPKAVREWYSKNLGMIVDDFGAPFEFRNANRPKEVNYLNWDAFPDTTSYFDPSEKEFMINYRVQNIEGLVARLKQNGATIVDEIATYDYGKFVHIIDLEGNKIELWEPVDSVLSKLGREANK